MRSLFFVLLLSIAGIGCVQPTGTPAPDSVLMSLPEPRLESDVSLEEALLNRRSVREYASRPVSLEEVSQLLWAAQGITAAWGGRTAPSAGALYPLEVYLVVGRVDGLAPGVYRYEPEEHELAKVSDGDVRTELAAAAMGQDCVKNGAIDIVIACVYDRTTGKYGEQGVRYVHMEAGHAAQNLYLQAAALNLGMVTVGAFLDGSVQEVLGLPQHHAPLYVIPVGRRA
ncbi:MAG: SagB/ThcOx family dehydrogenase [Chloroflexota bacterium]